MKAASKCDKHCELRDSVNHLQVERVIFHSSSCTCSCCVTLHFPPFCFFVFVLVICARDFYLSSFSLSSFSCLVFFRHFHHDLNVHIIFSCNF